MLGHEAVEAQLPASRPDPRRCHAGRDGRAVVRLARVDLIDPAIARALGVGIVPAVDVSARVRRSAPAFAHARHGTRERHRPTPRLLALMEQALKSRLIRPAREVIHNLPIRVRR